MDLQSQHRHASFQNTTAEQPQSNILQREDTSSDQAEFAWKGHES